MVIAERRHFKRAVVADFVGLFGRDSEEFWEILETSIFFSVIEAPKVYSEISEASKKF